MGHWFLEVEKKAEDVILHAKEHLDGRNEEPPSIITCSRMSLRMSQLSEPKTHQSAKRASKLYRKAQLIVLISKEAEEESARRKDGERAEEELEE